VLGLGEQGADLLGSQRLRGGAIHPAGLDQQRDVARDELVADRVVEPPQHAVGDLHRPGRVGAAACVERPSQGGQPLAQHRRLELVDPPATDIGDDHEVGDVRVGVGGGLADLPERDLVGQRPVGVVAGRAPRGARFLAAGEVGHRGPPGRHPADRQHHAPPSQGQYAPQAANTDDLMPRARAET
jgi:hypothetical protein